MRSTTRKLRAPCRYSSRAPAIGSMPASSASAIGSTSSSPPGSGVV
jgi:hypothetical protein